MTRGHMMNDEMQSKAVVGESTQPPSSRPHKRIWFVIICPIIGIILLGWGLNYLLIGHPVAKKLGEDTRNAGLSLSAHYRYYIDPSTLVLDLREVRSAAPLDLFRALFQSAETLHNLGRHFDRVVLARAGTPVFVMKGEEFSSLGEEFGAGQNPIYLIRTLPEKLYTPSGEPAYGRWEGGLLGVVGKQMDDLNKAAMQWSNGR